MIRLILETFPAEKNGLAEELITRMWCGCWDSRVHERFLFYYVMEYVAGKTLQQKLEWQGPTESWSGQADTAQLISGLPCVFHLVWICCITEVLNPQCHAQLTKAWWKLSIWFTRNCRSLADVASPIERKKTAGNQEFTAPNNLLGEQAGVRPISLRWVRLFNTCWWSTALMASVLQSINRQQFKSVELINPLNANQQDEHPGMVDKAVQNRGNWNPHVDMKFSQLQTDLNKTRNQHFLWQDWIYPLIERTPYAILANVCGVSECCVQPDLLNLLLDSEPDANEWLRNIGSRNQALNSSPRFFPEKCKMSTLFLDGYLQIDGNGKNALKWISNDLCIE